MGRDDTCQTSTDESETFFEGRFRIYYCNGKLGMHVPSESDLPASTNLFNAWKLWINGNPGHKSFDTTGTNLVSTPVRATLSTIQL
jgi:hypothetical protein